MRKPSLLISLVLLSFASTGNAETLYASPTGTETSACTTRAAPCSLSGAASAAVAGDTVVLMDGIYQESLVVANSGTSDAWITFEADECATPIIEGEGAGPADDVQTTGVGSSEAEYVRFRGIVSRGWNTGFGNGWVGGTDTTDVSNGHWDIENCIAYSNGRTGFTFYSASGFHLKNSISAHNGSSTLHSWSSGVTLFEAAGSENLVEGTVSFENTDAERHTDGSGFIVDEESNGATFLNNLAFGNAGSCFRLTKSSGTRFINNTCFHNSQFGSQATGPSNPAELYFTNGGVTQEGVTFMNNIIVGTGQAPAGSEPVINQPPSGWMNNVVTTGSVTFFMDPTGANPSFVPASGASDLIGKGSSSNGAPTEDLGFDPKCLVTRAPVMVGSVASESWWQVDVDIEYIQSIGGVASCFNAAMRPGTPDIGAYQAGAVTTVTPGSCVPPDPTGGIGGAGVGGAATAAGVGGASTTTGVGATSTTGLDAAAATSGVGGAANASSASVGGTPMGGVTSTSGVSGDSVGSTSASTGVVGAVGTGGDANQGPQGDSPADDQAGCACSVLSAADHRAPLAALGILGLGLFAHGRRRRRRTR